MILDFRGGPDTITRGSCKSPAERRRSGGSRGESGASRQEAVSQVRQTASRSLTKQIMRFSPRVATRNAALRNF